MPISRISSPWLMVGSSFSFACMGLFVKLAAEHHGLGEIVLFRSAVGAIIMAAVMLPRGVQLRTPVPLLHLWRSISGVGAICLLFYAISKLPLATAVTLNYMSSIWIAVVVMVSALVLRKGPRFDPRLLVAVVLGFTGVALVLRPTMDADQWIDGLVGLCSSLLSAIAYLQVASLGRAGEPEDRVVLYFSVGATVLGLMIVPFTGGLHWPTWSSALALVGAGASGTSAQLLLTRAYSIGKPIVNASLHYLGIAFSFIFGVLLFGDAITPVAVAGMALIVSAGVSASLLQASAQRRDRRRLALPAAVVSGGEWHSSLQLSCDGHASSGFDFAYEDGFHTSRPPTSAVPSDKEKEKHKAHANGSSALNTVSS